MSNVQLLKAALIGAIALSTTAREQFWSQLRTVFQSRLYVALVLVKATFLVGSTAHTVTATYYVRYVMQAPNTVLSAFLLVYSVGMIASQPAWLAACRRDRSEADGT